MYYEDEFGIKTLICTILFTIAAFTFFWALYDIFALKLFTDALVHFGMAIFVFLGGFFFSRL